MPRARPPGPLLPGTRAEGPSLHHSRPSPKPCSAYDAELHRDAAHLDVPVRDPLRAVLRAQQLDGAAEVGGRISRALVIGVELGVADADPAARVVLEVA